LLRHNYLGTEHLLLGLVREEEGVAGRVLEARGVTLKQVRERVKDTVGVGEEVATGQIPFTPRAKKVLERALREALTLGHNHIGTEHLLLGLAREVRGVGARILFELGISPREVAADVTARFGGERSPDYVQGFATEPDETSETPPEPSPLRVRRRPRRVDLASLLAGWLLFAVALGIGILVGWLAWG
jgi:ATP-dependent Clp protease ATP-binding subunit ClpC